MVHPNLATQTAQVFPYTMQVYFYDYVEIFFPREKTGGYSIKLYTWRLRPEVQPLSLLPTIFDKKRTPPFHIPYNDKWYSFHIPSLQLCIPFNSCKGNVF